MQSVPDPKEGRGRFEVTSEGLHQVVACCVLATVHEEQDALDEAPNGARTEGHEGDDKADDSGLGVAEVELVGAEAAQDDAKDSGYGLGLCNCFRRDAELRTKHPPASRANRLLRPANFLGGRIGVPIVLFTRVRLLSARVVTSHGEPLCDQFKAHVFAIDLHIPQEPAVNIGVTLGA